MDRKNLCDIVENLTHKNKIELLKTLVKLDLKIVEGNDGCRINIDRVTTENIALLLAQANFLQGLENIERKQNAAEL